ncbi:MAG: DUF952 domain-containing protein [Proteobacteria bacterium]|nr:MAG: DUF952 domain-containing protein [Pseudomonadota bacterium]
MIYHIAKLSDWNETSATGFYSLLGVGCGGPISCSTKHQFLNAANLYFANQTELLLLEVDERILDSKLDCKFVDKELSVRIMGPINTDAIVGIYS